MTLFSEEAQEKIKNKLNSLIFVCCPPATFLKPSFSFKHSSDFQYDDVLTWGAGGKVLPGELKNIWEDRETLRDHDIDYIVVDKQKWFFNTYDKNGRFFLEDGSRKVEIELPYWMEMTNAFEVSGIRGSIFQVLQKSMGDDFPTQEEARSCFSDSLCQRIYKKNPSKEAVNIALLEMVECVRKETIECLKQNFYSDILKEKSFTQYVEKRSYPESVPERQKVGEFLSARKEDMYKLAEKFGLIQNADKLFGYEQMRCYARHSNTMEQPDFDLKQIQQDFCNSLKFINKSKNINNESERFGDNIAVALSFEMVAIISEIFDRHVDSSLLKKKGKKAYYQDLIDKGLITEEEKEVFENESLTCNSIAHFHGDAEMARQKVSSSTKLYDLYFELSRRTHNYS